MMIETNGANLHVTDVGTGRPTLVFLHYWGGSGRTWIEVTSALCGRYRCVAPDLPGWGGSGPSGLGYRIADLASCIDSMITKLKLSDVVLVGHSMGGKVAQYLAGLCPEWLKGLVLVAPSPALPMAVSDYQRRAMQSAYATRASVEETIDNVLTASPIKGPARERVVEDSLSGHPDAQAAWPAYAMLEDISHLTRQIIVPTLLLVGEHDRVDPPAVLAERLVPFLPDPDVHELLSVGHLLPLEAPDGVSGYIAQWLGDK